MAQRLMYYADLDHSQLPLPILYASFPDDMVIHAFGSAQINVGTADSPLYFPTTRRAR